MLIFKKDQIDILLDTDDKYQIIQTLKILTKKYSEHIYFDKLDDVESMKKFIKSHNLLKLIQELDNLNSPLLKIAYSQRKFQVKWLH